MQQRFFYIVLQPPLFGQGHLPSSFLKAIWFFRLAHGLPIVLFPKRFLFTYDRVTRMIKNYSNHGQQDLRSIWKSLSDAKWTGIIQTKKDFASLLTITAGKTAAYDYTKLPAPWWGEKPVSVFSILTSPHPVCAEGINARCPWYQIALNDRQLGYKKAQHKYALSFCLRSQWT